MKKKTPHAGKIAHGAQKDDKQYGLSRDEGGDGTLENSAQRGLKRVL